MLKPHGSFASSLSMTRLGSIFLIVALIAAAISIGCSSADTSEPPVASEAPPPADTPITSADFRVRSELIFATSADLAFQIPGEVGEVNVTVGDLVAAGDVLATLDTDTLTDLRHAEALAELKVEQIRNELDRVLGLESQDPLIRAQSENALAKSEVALERAQDALNDYQLDHDVALGAARQRVADATSGLDRAQDAVTDFADAHGQQFADALAARAQARTTLEAAQDAVTDFLPLHDEAIVKLRASISNTEIAIDQTREALADFDKNHADRLLAAKQSLAVAESRLDNAQDALDEHFVKIVNEEFTNLTDGQNFDVVQLNALQAAVESAQRAVDSWNEEIIDLEMGPKEIERDNLNSRLAELESSLGILKDRLQDRLAGPDQEELQRLEANILVAQERINTAERQLAEVEQGVDQVELARLETAVESARVTLDSAQARLERLEEGPDAATIAALEQDVETARETRDDLAAGPDPVAVALVQTNLADAVTDHANIKLDLEDTVIRAPFDGLTRLVIIEPGDVVRVDARVIQVVDPQDIMVRGLVETNYVERIKVGASASVKLAAVSGPPLEASVVSVSQEASTERGVISFPVIFSVDVPEGVEIPPDPGLVTTTVMP